MKEQTDIKMNSALEMSKDEIVTGKEEAITHQIPSHDPPARESSSQKHVTLGANAPVFQPNSANQGYRNFEIQIGPLDRWRHRQS